MQPDTEDIDALPVAEQAAIYCSIMASNGRWQSNWDFLDHGDPVWAVTARASKRLPFDPWQVDHETAWGECEAQLRAGKARQ